MHGRIAKGLPSIRLAIWCTRRWQRASASVGVPARSRILTCYHAGSFVECEIHAPSHAQVPLVVSLLASYSEQLKKDGRLAAASFLAYVLDSEAYGMPSQKAHAHRPAQIGAAKTSTYGRCCSAPT
eukprot:6191673-Pleurochrysis_carterae.AAC.1